MLVFHGDAMFLETVKYSQNITERNSTSPYANECGFLTKVRLKTCTFHIQGVLV
jgi:hypothetical protein